MLDRTNIHFKKAEKMVLEKVNRIHDNTISVVFNQRYIDITMFDGDTNIYYTDMIGSHHSKEVILQKLENFKKMYYAWGQLQKKGGYHE